MENNSNKIQWGTALTLGGAFVATCCGSGFTTGSEFLQFFCAYGVKGAIGAIVLSFIIYFLFTRELFGIGQDLPEEQCTALFTYYFGKKVGTVMDWYCAIFVGGCYFIMMSGAGATFHQYLGWNPMIGSCLLAVVTVATVLLGLKKLTDIIGAIGPVKSIFVMCIGIFALAIGAKNLSTADAVVPTVGFISAAPNWAISGILYPCFAMLTLTPILPSMGRRAPNKRTTTAAALFGAILFHVALGITVLGILSHLDIMKGVQIPNLALANLMGPIVSAIFVLILFLAVYSTAVPMLWGFCAKIFKDEKSKKYKLAIIGVTIVGMVVTYFFPLSTLIFFLFGISGYVGAVVSVGMIISKMIKKQKAKALQ